MDTEVVHMHNTTALCAQLLVVVAILCMRHYHHCQHRVMASLPHAQEHDACIDLVSPDKSKHSALGSTLNSTKDACLIHIQELAWLHVHRMVVPLVCHTVECNDGKLVHRCECMELHHNGGEVA